MTADHWVCDGSQYLEVQPRLVAKDGGHPAEGARGGQVGQQVLGMVKQVSVDAANQLVPQVGEDAHGQGHSSCARLQAGDGH